MIKSVLPGLVSPWYWWKTGQELKLIWRISRDPRVPFYLRVVPWLAILYLLIPVDLVPGFIPFFGQLDDFAVVLLVLKVVTRLVPADILAEYQQQ